MIGKDLSYWRENPRQAIATVYKNNNMAYSVSGSHAASLIVKMSENYFGNTLKEIGQMTIFDIGGGTGRIARHLSFFFKSVYMYDPVDTCVALARVECQPMIFPNITYSTYFPSQKEKFDVLCSVNVLEHLSEDDQRKLLSQMKNHTKSPETPVILWAHSQNNYAALVEYCGESSMEKYKDAPPHLFVDTLTFLP